MTSNLTKYQTESRQTYTAYTVPTPIGYLAIGLNEEAGEVAGKIKKIYRDKNGVISEPEKQELIAELGDVLWYLTQICTEIDITLEEVVTQNLQKILSRQSRKKLHGTGDNR